MPICAGGWVSLESGRAIVFAMMPTATPAPSIEALTPSLWRLAWRQTWRDLRGGALRLVLLAVVLAVAALTAVGFFVDRFQRGLTRDAGALLGGDAVIHADQPVPAELRALVAAQGLMVAESATFPSMARVVAAGVAAGVDAPESEDAGGDARLASIKAVSEAYPLRGQLQIADAVRGPLRVVQSPPAPGTVWVDLGLMDALDLKVGDRLGLGDATLRIAQVLMQEPDRGAGFSTFAPRVMMRLEDLPTTGLIQPASRVSWRLGVVADGRDAASRLQALAQAVNAHIDSAGLRGVRLETLEGGRPEMRQTLERAEQFLKLVALLAALLAAVAVGVAAQGFARRRLDASAMLRVLGLAQWQMAVLHLIELGWVALAASAVGVGVGLAFHSVFVGVLGAVMQTQTHLPAPGWWPALLGLGTGMTLVLGFAVPPVLQLAQVPPLRVMRRELGRIRGSTLLGWGAGLLALMALLLVAAQDLRLGAITVGGFALAWVVFALSAWGVLAGVTTGLAAAQRRGRRWPVWLRLSVSQLAARRGMVVLQVSALGMGMLAIGLLVVLRTDLIDGWRQSTPKDAPDRFVINVLPEQGPGLQDLLHGAGVQRLDWYPMIRGRLVAVNGRDVKPEDYPDDRAQRLVDREFNLSHDAELPGHNTVSAGRWVSEEFEGLSVEEGLAKTLGLKLGDRLRFDVGGQLEEATITSLRRVDWASMRVNFFVMFPRAQMPDLPSTIIAAYRSPGPVMDKRIARDYPNVTQVDVGATLAQVQGVIGQVSRAVEFLFAFALACGLVVLAAAVLASREQRLRDFAIMRALGAQSRMLAQVQRAELLAVGALAGGLAAAATAGVAWVLAREVFQFAWILPWWLVPGGLLSGAVLAWAGGVWGLRGVLRAPVMATLRQQAPT